MRFEGERKVREVGWVADCQMHDIECIVLATRTVNSTARGARQPEQIGQNELPCRVPTGRMTEQTGKSALPSADGSVAGNPFPSPLAPN